MQAFNFFDQFQPLDNIGPVTDGRTLADTQPGDNVKIDEMEFIVLEHTRGETGVISKGFVDTREFGQNCQWIHSSLRSWLHGEYYDRIAAAVGEDSIISFARDLVSLDGLTDDGVCCDKVSLLTADEYRMFHEILGVGNRYPDWWWLITPMSTERNGYSRFVCCVTYDGYLNWLDSDGRFGVRPFLYLDSSISISD